MKLSTHAKTELSEKSAKASSSSQVLGAQGSALNFCPCYFLWITSDAADLKFLGGQEAKRSVADTVGKMFRECWKLDNPEAAVLIEALALQAELPIVLQPDVEEAVRYIRRNGPRRQ